MCIRDRVLIDKEEYIKKENEFIKSNNYEEIKYDYTNTFQSRVKKLIKNSTMFKNKIKLTESNPEAPKFKCQIKLHKENHPVRPIISFIGAPAYKLSKECSKILKVYYDFEKKHSIENNKKLIETLKEEVQVKELSLIHI